MSLGNANLYKNIINNIINKPNKVNALVLKSDKNSTLVFKTISTENVFNLFEKKKITLDTSVFQRIREKFKASNMLKQFKDALGNLTLSGFRISTHFRLRLKNPLCLAYAAVGI